MAAIDLKEEVLDKDKKRVIRLQADLVRQGRFFLAGGTGLGLRLGHRLSDDLDWFTPTPFEAKRLISKLSSLPEKPTEIVQHGAQTVRAYYAKLETSFITYAQVPARPEQARVAGVEIPVPFELGRAREYLGDPYVVAGALAGGEDYYLSHGSAMDIHGMTTQPRLVVYTTSTRPLRGRTILGTEFRFVRCKRADLFGATSHWTDKTAQVTVSDLERTIIDGLKQPAYCGGFSEVAKGYWMRRSSIDVEKLVGYALRLDVGVVIRRLGFLLETSGVDAGKELERLRQKLTATYHLLDPTLPPAGRRVARWRLRLNVSPEELAAARST